MRILKYSFFVIFVLSLHLLSASSAFSATETYDQAVSQAYDNAPNLSPYTWSASTDSIIKIPDTGGTHGLTYDTGTPANLVVRTATNSSYFFYNYVGQAGYTTYYDTKQTSGGAAWVTTGNDLTNFYTNNGGGATGINFTKFLERSLGMNSPGTHDAIVEYSVEVADSNSLMRPTANPEISSYNYDQFGSGKTVQGSQAFKDYYAYWQTQTAPGKSSSFPWTQLGYTYYWGNGGSPPSGVSQIQGMSEFIILGGTAVNIYGIYGTQSYIYTKNNGQYGNGYASFNITGPCDSVWAGHSFQYNVSRLAASPNEINVTNGGSVTGAQGILVWSLNYTVTVDSGCTVSSDGTSLKRSGGRVKKGHTTLRSVPK